MAWKVLLYVAVYLFHINNVSSMDVKLKDSVGKVVLGSQVTFTANVIDFPEGGETIRFVFHDNVQPQHRETFTLNSNTSDWTVEYQKAYYEPGNYEVTVELLRNYYGVWIRCCSDSAEFTLTETLNGNMVLSQDNLDRPNNFVAVNKTVHHYIKLPDRELKYLKGNSSSIMTYWFIDCVLVEPTTDMYLDYTYGDTMGMHHVEAILIANNEPLPTTTIPPTTTPVPTTTSVPTTTAVPTTTSMPTTTAKVTTTSVTPNVTSVSANVTEAVTVKPLNTSSLVNTTRTKRNAPELKKCNNIVPIGEHTTYGRYETVLNVREPLAGVNITGINWLQHGDLLNLQVKYNGSPPFYYCILYKIGQYNVTGNETCTTKLTTVSNNFPLVHYFSDSDQHTVVVIIENDMGKTVSRATINIYKTSVHAQLSVIVVPVVFCLVAVILVVFGIAYYQHRSRITIEVADFDFGQAPSDYKTFTERLRDSFRNAFNFGDNDDTDPLRSNSRYDSMT